VVLLVSDKMSAYPCLYIIRGLPGSGKSTLARRLVHESRHRESDMYHMKNGVYIWRKENVKRAHEWCFNEIERLVIEEKADVAVSNTFPRKCEYRRYILLAEQYGYKPMIIECHADFGSIHMVPVDTMKKLRSMYEPHFGA
jgi:predicted kinase